MYRSIVRGRIKAIFRAANAGNWQMMLDGLHQNFTYRFVGDTPLGGQRTTRKAMEAWWQRLFRLFPGAQFYPEAIVVEGPPWKTSVMTYVKIRGTVPARTGNGSEPYENEFMQLIGLRWGRIVSVTTLEDTQRFAAILPRLEAAGMKDATAAPITD
jgi:ketosteroid isomerase-like protein